ncbi:major facilitator superfamily transporter [Xylariomycetidae sp. FL0641]|nr:major facilitator superfamily transporter [Xylariomycetidae sp. FL0641]
MAQTIRDAPVGQLIRFLTGNRWLQYPEEKDDFELPEIWAQMLKADSFEPEPSPSSSGSPASSTRGPSDEESQMEKADIVDPAPLTAALTRTKSRAETLPNTKERLEVDQKHELEKTQSVPTVPGKTKDGAILVDWYYSDDPEPSLRARLRRRAAAVLAAERRAAPRSAATLRSTSVWTHAAAGFFRLALPRPTAPPPPPSATCRYSLPAFPCALVAGVGPAEGGRWSLLEVLWAGAPVFLATFLLLLPETSTPALLLLLLLEIPLKDPAVLFVQLYTAVVYGIYYYSFFFFFEVFPPVYPAHSGMDAGPTSAWSSCASWLACRLLGAAAYLAGLPALPPEPAHHPTAAAAASPRRRPAWSRPSPSPPPPAHPRIAGVRVDGAPGRHGSACFAYVPLGYPAYARRPVRPPASASPVLAGLSTVGILGIRVLYFTGARLRGLSKFAVSAA